MVTVVLFFEAWVFSCVWTSSYVNWDIVRKLDIENRIMACTMA
jgi:hypothetical protein